MGAVSVKVFADLFVYNGCGCRFAFESMHDCAVMLYERDRLRKRIAFDKNFISY